MKRLVSSLPLSAQYTGLCLPAQTGDMAILPLPQFGVPLSCSHTWRPELPLNPTSSLLASPSSPCATCCVWAKYRPYGAMTSPRSGAFPSTIQNVPTHRPWGRGPKLGVAHWHAPPPSQLGPTVYPSWRVPLYCSPKCGPYFGDQPPTRRDGMHGDTLGPPCSPGQALHSQSSLSGVGGSVSDKLGTICHRRYHGMSPSPSPSPFTHARAHKARRFRLPTIEGLAHSLRNVCADPWACKLDLKNCYWSVHLPPSLVNYIRVTAGRDRYAIVKVPSGWHQAPRLVQHLIDRVLSSLPPTVVLVVQYLDNIFFVGPRPDVKDMARRAAATLEQAGYIISPKSKVGPPS